MRHDVAVVEAADVVGGMLGRHTHGSFGWDTGPTTVTLPATLRDLFLKTGRPLETVLDLEALEPIAHYRFADGTEIDLPNTGVADVAAAFDAAFGGSAGDDWRRFHDYASRLWTATRGPFVESALTGRRDLARLALRHPGQLSAVAGWRSLRDVGTRFFRDPRQRRILERYAGHAGADPRRAPASVSVFAYVEHTFRAWSVPGGLRRLVDAVHDRAVERGAVVHTGVPAVAITTAAGRVDGVRLGDGRHLPADVVVSDVSAAQLYGELLPHEPSRRRLAQSTASPSAFMLLLGLRGHTPDMRRHTVLFPTDGDAELDAVFGNPAMAAREPTISVHVSRRPGDAPDDGEAWTVQVTAPRHGSGPGAIDWTDDASAAYAHHLLDLLAARGLEVRDRVDVLEHRSPADIEQATRSPGGGLYGTATDSGRAAVLRPANRSPVPGLFLVGGSAHPGGGLPLVTMSAALVAEMVGRA